jgi:hypothetical protein
MKNFPRIFPYQLIHNDDLRGVMANEDIVRVKGTQLTLTEYKHMIVKH